jgi:hypothetical protein
MSRVSYQVALAHAEAPAPMVGAALDPGAIDTRRRAGVVRVSVKLSKPQARWLRNAAAGADTGAVLRALVDLGMEMDIDWSAITKPADMREAVREAVLIRRRGH